MTIVDHILRNAEQLPDREIFSCLSSDLEIAEQVTNEQLLNEIQYFVNHLLHSTQENDRVLILLPTSIDFVVVLCACFLSKRIAVPLPAAQNKRALQRFLSVTSDCSPALAITDTKGKNRLTALLKDKAPVSCQIRDVEEIRADLSETPDTIQTPSLTPSDLAVLQYTSGTTGTPKGVCLTHANLTANLEAISKLTQLGANEVSLNWLPLYHDFGLVGGVLRSLWLGCRTYLLPPAFVYQSPLNWFEALSTYEITVTSGTNTTLALLLESDKELPKCPHLQALFLGGEFVSPQVFKDFTKELEVSDVSEPASCLRPIYGMAETTLAATQGGGIDSKSSTIHCGQAIDAINLTIDHSLGSENEGEIIVSGPTVSPGYWSNDLLETQELQESPPFRTGDLGFLNNDGALVVTGRVKNLIVLNGENYHAEDFEITLADAGLGPAIAVTLDDQSDAGFMVICEHATSGSETQAELMAHIESVRTCLEDNCGVEPDRVVILRQHRIPLTPSGKPERLKARTFVLNGSLSTKADWVKTDLETTVSTKSATEIKDWLKAELSETLMVNEDAIAEDVDFLTLGLDSAHAVSLALELEDFAGVELAASILFEFPTIERLAEHLGNKDSELATSAS